MAQERFTLWSPAFRALGGDLEWSRSGREWGVKGESCRVTTGLEIRTGLNSSFTLTLIVQSWAYWNVQIIICLTENWDTTTHTWRFNTIIYFRHPVQVVSQWILAQQRRDKFSINFCCWLSHCVLSFFKRWKKNHRFEVQFFFVCLFFLFGLGNWECLNTLLTLRGSYWRGQFGPGQSNLRCLIENCRGLHSGIWGGGEKGMCW